MKLAAFAALAAMTAACSSGGGNVQGGNSLNPTPVPSGVTASPTSGAVASPTASAAPTSTGVSASPTASAVSSSPSPTASPTAPSTSTTPTPSPSPSATATSGGTTTACTISTASPASMTYTFTGNQQNITLPTYNNYVGTSEIPYNNQPGGTVTVKISQQNFDNAPSSTSKYPNYAARTKDLYSTLDLGQTTTFYNDSAKTNTSNVPIEITETSPCIMPGVTYYVDLFALGSAQDENSAVATTASNGEGTVTGPFHVTVNPFTGGLNADVVLSH